jgi:tRNA modification GTPase
LRRVTPAVCYFLKHTVFFFKVSADHDTIVALSTPPGRSGIGVIRLSGAGAVSILRSLLLDSAFTPEPARVILKSIYDPASGDKLDSALVTYFKAPHSFTGEDVIEISCHGSPALLTQMIELSLSLGARAADRGEFTFRALLNGRLNLTQAEAVRDLIEAQTRAAVRQAAKQLGGEFSARLQPYKNSLIEIIVPLESALEFVEDDLPEDLLVNMADRLSNLGKDLEQLASTFRAGKLFKDGLRITLAGRPNAGKSSIFNRLLSSNRAIVTDIPGTTRDTITELISVSDVPIALTDTAGLRSAIDSIERLGIERTHRSIVDADLTILVLDGTQNISDEETSLLNNTRNNKFLIVLNKSDLPDFIPSATRQVVFDAPVLEVSAKTGAGIELLRSSLLNSFAINDLSDSDFIITNARHFDLLCQSANAVTRAEALMRNREGEELVLQELHIALQFLGEITGETTPEEILTHIFSTFCIGK